jgi:hypothetical protein
MSRVLSNIAEIFAYSTVYLFIVMVVVRLVAANLSLEFEKQDSNSRLAASVIIAGLLVGLGFVISAVIQG